ncbi:tetronasin resistance protein [Fundicoccus culcitae]|uniref:Tetronasin resistance protein n=1 Tax=Fundicoccus culcitae TaxID=2969821 RepID=A0ABY5PA14_9LACT|nr:tetronasin resistance protein [Fundicoccus culcitae]UUX35455.1 tetronasin resistance protein [Fundicoccus culcitae]
MFGRWEILFFQYLKRDFKKIIFWVVGLGLFSAAFVPAFEEIAKGQGAFGFFETMQNPAMIAIVGPTPIETATEYTIGAMYSHEMLLFCSLFAMVVSILHVIGHTRKEEDLGLTELIRSFQVGRQANSLAVILETLLINAMLVIFIAVIMVSFGVETVTFEGAVLFAFSVGLSGVFGAVLALLVAQIMSTSAAATGVSLAVLGFLYILRGLTDIVNVSWSMLNPMGWLYLTFPFTENNWLPVGLELIFCFLLLCFALILEGKRDVGAGFIPEKEGRANAKASLLSVPGIFIRLNRGLIVSWLIAYLVLGAAYGAIYGDMASFLEGNDLLKLMFTFSGVTIEESFTAVIMMVMVSLVTILPLVLINRLFSYEKNLYLSQIHGTKVKRRDLYWTNIVLAVLVAVLGFLFTVGGLAGAALSVMQSQQMSFSDFLLIGFNLFPTILFFIGFAALVVGWIPRFGSLLYIYLAYAFFLNYFQNLVEFPTWLLNTSPQNWLPMIPLESFQLNIFATILVVSLVMMLVGGIGYGYRDRLEGA